MEMETQVLPCKWSDEATGVCMLDGLACDGECESFEPEPN